MIARRPLHLAPPAHELDVIFREAVDPIATTLFGGLTGTVGSRQDRSHVFVVGGDRHDTDAGAEAKHAVFPGEAEITHALAQRLRRAHRFIQRATLEQNAELVAPETRQGVAPADFRLQERAHLPQQRVARAVATGIVDDLELVDIEITQRVGGFPGFRTLQCPLDTAFKLTPVHEAREKIVTRVVGKTTVELARLAHVMEYQHAAGDVAGAIANRRRRALNIQLIAVATDE